MYKASIITYAICAIVSFLYGIERGPLWFVFGAVCLACSVWYAIKDIKAKKDSEK